MSRTLLLAELRFLHQNLKSHYLTHWPLGKNDWRPSPVLFSLWDLACHLCASPMSTAAILAGEPRESIIHWGAPLKTGTQGDLERLLDEGMERLIGLLESYTDEEYQSKPVPWPFGEPRTPQWWALTTITHWHHHRAQLHTYLKQLGLPVDTDSLYAAG